MKAAGIGRTQLRTRLTELADELGELAERLAETTDHAEVIRLKSAMTRGFYGD